MTPGAARAAGWTRWLGVIGAVFLVAGLLTAYDGALGADLSSAWDYCGAGRTIVTVPCHCPQQDIETTWPDGSIVCFTPAPDSAYSIADIGAAAIFVGALLVALGTLLRLGRVGLTWLVIRSALTLLASLFVAGLAVLLASGPPCVDCPSSPSYPAFAGAATAAGLAAVVVLVAALLPPVLRVVASPSQRKGGGEGEI